MLLFDFFQLISSSLFQIFCFTIVALAFVKSSRTRTSSTFAFLPFQLTPPSSNRLSTLQSSAILLSTHISASLYRERVSIAS